MSGICVLIKGAPGPSPPEDTGAGGGHSSPRPSGALVLDPSAQHCAVRVWPPRHPARGVSVRATIPFSPPLPRRNTNCPVNCLCSLTLRSCITRRTFYQRVLNIRSDRRTGTVALTCPSPSSSGYHVTGLVPSASPAAPPAPRPCCGVGVLSSHPCLKTITRVGDMYALVHIRHADAQYVSLKDKDCL